MCQVLRVSIDFIEIMFCHVCIIYGLRTIISVVLNAIMARFERLSHDFSTVGLLVHLLLAVVVFVSGSLPPFMRFVATISRRQT